MATVVRAAAAALALVLSLPLRAGAEPDAPFFESRLIFDRIPDRPEVHASTLTQLPDGRIMAAWFAGTAEKARDVAILSATFDGERWTAPAILNDAEGLSEGNPVLYADPHDRVWFFYLVLYGDTWNDCRIHYRVSLDRGSNFGPEQTLVARKGYAIRNRPILLDDGAVLLPAANEVMYTPYFIRTEDWFETMTATGLNLRAPTGLDQPAVVQLDDGSVLAYFRSAGRIMRAVSRDRGLTWQGPEPTKLPNPDAGIAMARLRDGDLVLVFNNSPERRSPLTVALSSDQGETWDRMRDLETEDHEFSYPCVIQDRDGLIHVSYTYKRSHIKHAALAPEWVSAPQRELSD